MKNQATRIHMSVCSFLVRVCVCRCSSGWTGLRCESVATGESTSNSGEGNYFRFDVESLLFRLKSKVTPCTVLMCTCVYLRVCLGTASIIIPVLLLLLLILLAVGALFWYRRRMRG